MRCVLCKTLCIQVLLDWRKKDYDHKPRYFPSAAFFSHHASVGDLQRSAGSGCDLCQLFLHGMRETLTHWCDTQVLPNGVWWDESVVRDWKTWSLLEHATQHPLESSDVSICIKSFHSVGGESEHELLLDQLSVKVGKNNYMKFVLTTPDQQVYLDGYRISRREVATNLDSPANYDLARGWIKQCCQEHPGLCSLDRDTTGTMLPTRVIDVGSTGSTADVRVFVSNGTRGRYLALSHCWGGPIAAVLTTQTLQPFSTAIPRHMLAHNFQDAVDIARQLGVRYLWIDSLCILQDSNADWARESEKMADVYQNALLTIAALSSPASGHGIFPRSSPAAVAQVVAEIPLIAGEKRGVTARLHQPPADDESLTSLDGEAPLNKRAWCLQEAVLSRRILYYGAAQIYFGCGDGLRAANEVPENIPSLPFIGSSPAALLDILVEVDNLPLPLRGDDLQPVLRRYYDLVEVYSRRSLTFDKDRLPAISGLAKRLHGLIGGDYAAGVWTTDFRQGILWSPKDRGVARRSAYIAPSWSWVSAGEGGVFVLEGPLHLALDGSDNLELLAHNVVLKDQLNQYGEITSGQITVKGLTARLRRVHGVEFDVNGPGHVVNVWFDEPDGEGWFTDDRCYAVKQKGQSGDDDHVQFEARGHNPTTTKPGDPTIEKEYMVLLVIRGASRRYGSDKMEEESIILEPVVGANVVYRRVGRMTTGLRDQAPSVTWTERTVTII